MKHVLKFVWISAVCWFAVYLILWLAGGSYPQAPIAAVPVGMVLGAVITIISYFVGRIEKLEVEVRSLREKLGEFEKGSK